MNANFPSKVGIVYKGKEQQRNLPSGAGSCQQMVNVISPAAAHVLRLMVESTVQQNLVIVFKPALGINMAITRA